nr:MAG TPA: hypothetical protein [Caudoviricetes sp.]
MLINFVVCPNNCISRGLLHAQGASQVTVAVTPR